MKNYDWKHWLCTISACAAAIAGLTACGGGSEGMNCDNLLAADEVRFSDVEALVLSSGKGCASANCHGSNSAAGGYRFDDSVFIYDEFTTRIDAVYPQVASGAMPAGGRRWSDHDLQLVRTWYCSGANPND